MRRRWDETPGKDGLFRCRIPIGTYGVPMMKLRALLASDEVNSLQRATIEFDEDEGEAVIEGWGMPTPDERAALELLRIDAESRAVAADRRTLEQIKARRPDWFQLHVTPEVSHDD